MQEEQFRIIAGKVADHSATDQELAVFLYHINSFSKEAPHWESLDPELKKAIRVSLEQDIMQAVQPDVDPGKAGLKKRMWPGIAIAASIALAVTIGGYFYFNNQQSKTQQVSTYGNDIPAGKVGATLTLGSGKQIRLADAVKGELADEAGVLISKTDDGKLVYELRASRAEGNKVNTISTAEGETYQLRLPDGTSVWLNAASSLTYSTNLNDGANIRQRRVSLQGEAYFEVARDKTRPFIVSTQKQKVEVLGTHFNINGYANEPAVATTLLEGSVQVSSENGKKILLPGQQALNNGNSIQVNEVNPETVMDWKDGDFNLDELDFKVAMRKIARWYNVDIVYEPSVPDNIKSWGWISRSRSLLAVLKHIESSGQVHFKVENRTVYVTK